MLRALLLIVAIVVLVWLARRALRARGAREEGASPNGSLVPCANCGVLLPQADARVLGTLFYCSEQHASAGPKRAPGGD